MNKLQEKTIERLLGLTLFVGLVTLWQVAADLGWIKTLYFGIPLKIVESFFWLFRSGFIWEHLLYSLQSFTAGFGIALGASIVLGLLIGSSQRAYKIFGPYIFALQVIPKIVLLPLIIIWFGIGMNTRITLIVIMSVIPMLITTTNAIRNVSPKLLEMGKSFGASKSLILKNISFHAALPEIFTGIRIGLGRATSGMIIAEYFGINKGLGSQISYFGSSYQTNKLFALIIVVVLWNIIMLNLLELIASRVKNY